MELARCHAAREVRDEGVGQLVQQRVVEVGVSEVVSPPMGRRTRPSKPSYCAARPRRRAGRVVVALLREQDDRDGRGGLVAEGPHERRVVPVEHPEDLTADVLVRVAVVAHVEVGEARLVE